MQGFNIGTDFDGVLCEDCPVADDDDGERYVNWMRSVKPILRPGPGPIPVIITARLEKYRGLTEEWPARHSIKCDRLIMGPWNSLAERATVCIGSWKREMAEAAGCRMFVESCWIQTQVMSSQWDRPVICPAKKTTLVRGQGPQWTTLS